MNHIGRVSGLALLAVAGQSIIYILTAVLARRLGVDEFEAYAVGSAAFTLMVTYTPRGVEKYALRLLPTLFERGDWRQARGFLRFGLRRTLATSLLVGITVYVGVTQFSNYPRATQLAIVASCLSLPAGALVHYYVEVLSANGRHILAALLFRVVVPITTLTLVGSLILLPISVNGAIAVGCWGIAWGLALAAMLIQVKRTTPIQVWQADLAEEKATWGREARPFLSYRVSLALLAQIGVIAFDQLHPSAAAVGGYVVAMSTANLALVLATSTNRFYSRLLSVLLEQRDYAGVLDLRRQRLRWLVPVMVVFLISVFVFGRAILGFFRPEFVSEGIAALQILAVTASISVLFSLAPTYLKYTGHNRLLNRLVMGAAAVQVILLLALVPSFAATGAAVAYAVSMCGMYLGCSWVAHRELTTLASKPET